MPSNPILCERIFAFSAWLWELRLIRDGRYWSYCLLSLSLFLSFSLSLSLFKPTCLCNHRERCRSPPKPKAHSHRFETSLLKTKKFQEHCHHLIRPGFFLNSLNWQNITFLWFAFNPFDFLSSSCFTSMRRPVAVARRRWDRDLDIGTKMPGVVFEKQ